MLYDEPFGCESFAVNLADPPSSAVPHSGGFNVAFGDGHVKFHRMETAWTEYACYPIAISGNGIYPGQ
jgi:prepilin-type processing-associated H-X9-DG protein